MIDKVYGWGLATMVLFSSVFDLTVNAVLTICAIALILVFVDFITGVLASGFDDSLVRLKSRKMRWSFVKLAVYVVGVSFTAIVGVMLHTVELTIAANNQGYLTAIGLTNELDVNINVLYYTLYAIKVEAWFIAWIEAVSIVENLRRIFGKDNLFLKYLHFILAVEFVNLIPKLSKMLKERDNKNACEEFETPQKN